MAAAQGTVYMWLGSLSHETVPELLTLMNLYSTTLPGARLTDAYHSGLLLVYCDAPSVTALAVFQLPRAAVLPVLYDVLLLN